ncbi:polysaccharide biosynthesis/export family protein [Loktanella sp. TSTF-M6]|uniref:Polysaccharide biosynthesis/export family protein n=1 Tax=Loktanella gaetbuli TaxID=2881335 RepID=A0ABS8BY74_9RHOB|nr:polysaccharide biosynthesis/export family protein [Loktanella gaetbuli]MCB5200683.1 polysaccharide biosynthesis/export family protein [Loktanella gaetbuli]
MNVIMRTALLTVLTAGLAACNAPRGAGFQSEVLAASSTQVSDVDGTPVYDFSVFSVTRDSLPVLQAWPSNNTDRMSWISHQAQPQSMIITPGDTLAITIWDAEENSLLTAPGQRVAQLQNVKVGPDGRIFLPFVGNMRVSGMAPDTARTRIQEMLVNTVPSAQVQLSVDPGRANTANLVSGVRAPGVYPLPDRNVSLLTLLSLGGGVNDALPNPQVRLFRGNRSYGIGLNRLFDDPSLDTVIQGGDRVLIEADDRYFLSLGATTTESLHVFPKDEVTALDALAIIGGVNDARANPQAILVLREYAAADTVAGPVSSAGPPQERVVFTIDLTSADGLFSAGKFQIQPGDLVYATESPLGATASVIGLAGATLGLAN